MADVAKRWSGDGKQGVHIWCPGCDGVHGITTTPPYSWTWNGDLVKPTFSPSLLVRYAGSDEAICHSFVRDGRIEFLNDCTHALAGQTVDLPPWPYGEGT